jgi:hypothetical protein
MGQETAALRDLTLRRSARVRLGHSAMAAQYPLCSALRTRVGHHPRSEKCHFPDSCTAAKHDLCSITSAALASSERPSARRKPGLSSSRAQLVCEIDQVLRDHFDRLLRNGHSSPGSKFVRPCDAGDAQASSLCSNDITALGAGCSMTSIIVVLTGISITCLLLSAVSGGRFFLGEALSPHATAQPSTYEGRASGRLEFILS